MTISNLIETLEFQCLVQTLLLIVIRPSLLRMGVVYNTSSKLLWTLKGSDNESINYIIFITLIDYK